MELFDLSDKVAIVTGGNGGIGLAYAKGLVKAGAQVAIWGRNKRKNNQAVEALTALGGDAIAFAADLTRRDEALDAFQATVDHYQKVDICFANAGGVGRSGRLHQLTSEEWQAVLDLNLNSVVHTYQPVLQHLLDRGAPGKLIVTSSIAALVGAGFASGYAATKAAVLGLTRALAVEYGRKGIQVNAILPGYIETELTSNATDVFREAMLRRSCSGKYGTLEQMEGIAVFLASASSDFMTGQSIVLDGGNTIYPL
ncbi:MAG: SDR family oxidoreductase [Saprospiraceae bacterium]|nr:SDR family oxidoreductase [Saprospiraceae bacterium]